MKCLYYTHIVKTGGSSIRKFFHDNDLSIVLNTGDINSSGHNSFSKNYYHGLIKKYDEVITAIALRDPVKHLLSYYAYAKAYPQTSLYNTVIDRTFSEWIRFVPDFKNYYVRFLNHNGFFDPNSINNLNGIACNYDKALNILRNMDYVMDTDNLDFDMGSLFKKNNENISFNLHWNVSNANEVDIYESDIEYIKKIRELDYKLIDEFNIRLFY